MFLDSVHSTHRQHLGKSTIDLPDVKNVEMGDVIQFVYKGEPRTVYVLNPDYKRQLHGLTLLTIERRVFLTEVIRHVTGRERPMEFYRRVIDKPKVIETDSYRTYETHLITNVQKLAYEY